MRPALDLEAYRRDGFLACRFPLFTAPALDALDALAEEYRRDVSLGRRPADLNVPHFADPRLFAWLMSDAVLDVVEPIVGPDIALWTSQFFCKAARSGRPIGWHADGVYWEGFIEPVEVVSVWLALDETDAGNGCLRVVRGSHRRRNFRYGASDCEADPFFPRAVASDEFDPSDVVAIDLARGQFVLFDAWLVHGSEANRSARLRRGFTMRYMPATNRFFPLGRRGAAALAKRALAPALTALRGRPVYEHRIYLARGAGCIDNRYSPWPRSTGEALLQPD